MPSRFSRIHLSLDVDVILPPSTQRIRRAIRETLRTHLPGVLPRLVAIRNIKFLNIEQIDYTK